MAISALYVLTFQNFHYNNNEKLIIIIPILQMRKLEYREVK